MTGSRIGWIDYSKGVGIILVVIGHVLLAMEHANLPVPAHMKYAISWMYSFHMPLFFVLSGILATPALKNSSRGSSVRRLSRIAYCYLFWSVVHWLLRYNFSQYTNYRLPWDSIIFILYQPIGELWFLYVLIAINIVVAILFNWGLENNSVFYIAVVLALLSWHFGIEGQIGLFAFHFPFFAAGLWFSDFDMAVNPMFKRLRTSQLIVMSSILFFALSLTVIRPFIHEIPQYFRATLGIAATFFICFALARSNTLSFFRYCGRASLAIYVLHTCIAAPWRIFLQKYLAVEDIVPHLVGGSFLGILVPMAVLSIARRMNVSYWLFPARS